MHSTQIIPILKIMRLTQIIPISKIMPVDSQLTKIAPTNRMRQEIKRARDGSNKQETLVGMSGLWLLLIKKMLGKIISPEQSKTKANGFVTRVANKKWRLRSGRRLSWSSRMGWRVVSTKIFEWLFNLWSKMWTNYCVVVADNLLIKDKPSIKAPSVKLALGL